MPCPCQNHSAKSPVVYAQYDQDYSQKQQYSHKQKCCPKYNDEWENDNAEWKCSVKCNKKKVDCEPPVSQIDYYRVVEACDTEPVIVCKEQDECGNWKKLVEKRTRIIRSGKWYAKQSECGNVHDQHRTFAQQQLYRP